MRYYKSVADGYVCAVEQRESPAISKEITEAEYNEILTMLRNRPTAPEGYGYRLTESLEWELYELPPAEEIEEDPELSDGEVLSIIVNGGTE